ncbi:TRAP transporter substrate-binding protein DctP [Puniceibacterium sp. IMCC21224]|uniref:TRAP transporter substrate-binding protein n=1 Tax=Puniceibacterium sp. IMCC21224 TaxID=1618204 RepID=UPI00065D17EC|nr:TRAP transporter substrate-binding protein DctP [Puniceibacterium sp. IMCC21224]KMK65918.1 TRAP-type C4-dicarboxylate transport system, periplasmic component [Puniceibacterium sp. IMCC21224]
MTLNRRTMLTRSLAASAVLATPAILRAASAVELTILSGSPDKHVISRGGVAPFMEKLKETVGDAISYNYFPAGQLAPLKQLLGAVQSGVGDAAPLPVGYSSDKMPLNGVTMLPGLGASAHQIIAAYSKAVKDPVYMNEYEANNVVPIWNMAFPPYQYVATDEAVKTLEGFKGKVIRSAGGSTNLAVQQLGASPTEVAAGDIYVAMERGTVSATISSYLTIEGYGVAELCKAASRNGSFGNFSNIFCISAKKWETIPDDIQKAMMDAGQWTEDHVADVMDTEAEELAKKFEGLGVEIYDFPADQLALINDKLAFVQEDWVERLEARGVKARQALDLYKSTLAEMSA